jgi:serine/threonine-protein kinase
MEFLTGRSLYDEIQAHGPMEPARACRLLREIGRGIRAAHAVGIVHRDLKPENVMLVPVDEGEAVKVLDFGISADAEPASGSRLTQAGQAIGTPEYMAPEQARGEPATPRFDIYALGMIGYEMLAGATPYTGEAPLMVLARKASEAAPSLALARAGLPPALVALVDACLDRDPAARPASIDGFLERLDGVLRGIPRDGAAGDLQAPAVPSRAAQARAPAKGRRRLVAAAATAAAALAAVAAWWATRSSAASQGMEALTVAAEHPGVRAGTMAAPVGPAPTNPSDPVIDARPPTAPPVAPPAPAATPAAAPPPAPAGDHGETPRGRSKPRAPAPAPAPRCDGVVERAREAAAAHDWDTLLAATREAGCFPERVQRTRWRVRALQESGADTACVSEAKGSSDAAVLAVVRICQARLDRSKGG